MWASEAPCSSISKNQMKSLKPGHHIAKILFFRTHHLWNCTTKLILLTLKKETKSTLHLDMLYKNSWISEIIVFCICFNKSRMLYKIILPDTWVGLHVSNFGRGPEGSNCFVYLLPTLIYEMYYSFFIKKRSVSCSTCWPGFGCWELSISLKLRKKELLAKLDKFTTIFIPNNNFELKWLSFCEFALL